MGKFGPYLPKFGPKKFFFEIWASSLFLTYLRLVSCKKSKKSYERFPRKTPDRRTNERTNGRTDERTNGSESIGPTSEVGGSKNEASDSNTNDSYTMHKTGIEMIQQFLILRDEPQTREASNDS